MTAATIAVGAAARPRARTGVRRERHEPAYALLLAVHGAHRDRHRDGLLGVERSLVLQPAPTRRHRASSSWSGPASGSSAWSWPCGSTSATCATWRSRSTSSRWSCWSSCSCPASARRSTARGAGSSSPASARSSRPSSRSSPSSSTWPTGSTGAGQAAGTLLERARPVRRCSCAPGFFLIAAEPDLGTAGVYVVVAVSIFFMAGANLLYLGAIVSARGRCGLADDQQRRATSSSGSRPSSIPFRDPLGSRLQHDPGAAGARPGRADRPRPRREPPEVPLPAGPVDRLHLRDHRRGVGPRRAR